MQRKAPKPSMMSKMPMMKAPEMMMGKEKPKVKMKKGKNCK